VRADTFGSISIMNRIYDFLGITAFIIGSVYLAFTFGVNVGYERNYDASILRAKIHVEQLGTEVALYQLDHGNYPSSLEMLVGDYLKKLPTDPWGNDFGYISDTSKAIIFTSSSPERGSKQVFHVERKKI